MRSNTNVADILGRYAAALSPEGADRFKNKAYRRAAETIEGLHEDVADLVHQGRDLTELPGWQSDHRDHYRVCRKWQTEPPRAHAGAACAGARGAAAQQRGYEYIAITDHSQSLRIINGLSEDRLLQQIAAIDKLNATLKGVPRSQVGRGRHPGGPQRTCKMATFEGCHGWPP